MTVTWTRPPTAGAEFRSIYSNVARIDLPWGSQIDTWPTGGFAAGGVLVSRLVVQATAA